METLLSLFDLQTLLMFLLLGAGVGILAGLFGVGGGMIIVPALIWGLPLLQVSSEHSSHLAVGTSLATIVVTSIVAVRAHQKRKAVLWREFGLLTPGILLGAWLGGVLAGGLAGDTLQRLYGLFAVLVGLHLFIRKTETGGGGFRPGQWFKAIAGGVIGFVSAVVGIGGGTMTVPLLNAAGAEMRKAVATSSACGLPIALSGALSFMYVGWGLEGLPAGSSGYIYWPVVLIIVVTSSLFAPLGALLAHRLSGQLLKRLVALFLLLVGSSLLLK